MAASPPQISLAREWASDEGSGFFTRPSGFFQGPQFGVGLSQSDRQGAGQAPEHLLVQQGMIHGHLVEPRARDNVDVRGRARHGVGRAHGVVDEGHIAEEIPPAERHEMMLSAPGQGQDDPDGAPPDQVNFISLVAMLKDLLSRFVRPLRNA